MTKSKILGPQEVVNCPEAVADSLLCRALEELQDLMPTALPLEREQRLVMLGHLTQLSIACSLRAIAERLQQIDNRLLYGPESR